MSLISPTGSLPDFQPKTASEAQIDQGMMQDVYDVHVALALVERDNPAIRRNDVWLRLRILIYREFIKAYADSVTADG